MAGQLWVTGSLGGYMSSQNLSKVLRSAVQPLTKFRQFCDAKDETMGGLNKGDTYHWNVFSDIATQGTTLVETSTMPESNFTIIQGTMTITEFGNSVPFTQKLDNLSEQPVRDIINKVLKNDAKKAFDFAAHLQFNQAQLRVVPTSSTSTTALTLTTNGTATLTSSIALQKEHVKLIVDLMKERNIPAYSGDDYMAIARPTTFRRLKNDMEAIHLYLDRGFDLIMKGEIGKYESTRFIEQTNIPKGVAFTGTVWSATLSDWAYFFGSDTVTEAIAIPEEIRGKIPTDYGRSRGVAWYYLGGFGIAHPSTDVANQRIVKWDSAA
jgi:N4-gp56 family major capsid protein